MNKITELDNQAILVNDPLYTEYDISEIDDKSFLKFALTGSIDVYCPNCEKLSVFKVKGPEYWSIDPEKQKIEKFGLVEVHAKCTRQDINGAMGGCHYSFFALFKRYHDELIKIGQHPSKAEIDFGVLDECYKELPETQRKELGTAIGLYAHGVGIGSFVYLRRIFEGLVKEAGKEAKSDSNWDSSAFKAARMDEKIKLLKGYLPNRLTNSSQLYGVLSKGIHELTEEECKRKFPIVKQAIQLILKEKHEEKEYEKVIKNIK